MAGDEVVGVAVAGDEVEGLAMAGEFGAWGNFWSYDAMQSEVDEPDALTVVLCSFLFEAICVVFFMEFACELCFLLCNKSLACNEETRLCSILHAAFNGIFLSGDFLLILPTDFVTKYLSKVTCLKFFCTPFLLLILCFMEADEWI